MGEVGEVALQAESMAALHHGRRSHSSTRSQSHWRFDQCTLGCLWDMPDAARCHNNPTRFEEHVEQSHQHIRAYRPGTYCGRRRVSQVAAG